MGFTSWPTWVQLQLIGHLHCVMMMCALHFMLFFIRNPHTHTSPWGIARGRIGCTMPWLAVVLPGANFSTQPICRPGMDDAMHQNMMLSCCWCETVRNLHSCMRSVSSSSVTVLKYDTLKGSTEAKVAVTLYITAYIILFCKKICKNKWLKKKKSYPSVKQHSVLYTECNIFIEMGFNVRDQTTTGSFSNWLAYHAFLNMQKY